MLRNIIRVVCICVAAVLLAACGANPSDGHFNAPTTTQRHSNSEFKTALAKAGYANANLEFDTADRKWLILVAVGTCRVEIDELRGEANDFRGFEIDQIGSNDSVSAGDLGLSSLKNVRKKTLFDALFQPFMRGGKPTSRSKTFGC